jgi:hypothetical protein
MTNQAAKVDSAREHAENLLGEIDEAALPCLSDEDMTAAIEAIIPRIVARDSTLIKLAETEALRRAADVMWAIMTEDQLAPRKTNEAKEAILSLTIPSGQTLLDQHDLKVEEAGVLKGQHMIRDLIRSQIPYFEDNKVSMSIARYVNEKVAEAIERDRIALTQHDEELLRPIRELLKRWKHELPHVRTAELEAALPTAENANE